MGRMAWPFPFSFVQPSAPESRRPGAALAVGAVAGLVGAAVKVGWEGWFPPLPPEGRTPPPIELLKQQGIDPDERTYRFSEQDLPWAVPALHFGTSAAMVALYAVATEYLPKVKVAWGIPYGIGVWFFAHEVALPALKLSPPAADLPRDEQISEFLGHIAWIVAAEFVRRDLRQRITGAPDAEVRSTAVRKLLSTARAGLAQTVRTVRS
jgi:putative membrane protein